jgi:pyruvate formate-lyase/glycerol dehydratase family glycyl radical enzyme
MTPRIGRMLRSLRITKYPLCIEKFRIATDTLAKTEGESSVVRRGKIIKNVLENITIFIEDDELFAGAGASKPFGLEVDYEYGTWTQDEIDSLKTEQYSISTEDEAEIQAINTRFGSKNLVSAMGEVFFQNERLWPFMKSGMILPPWKGKKVGSGGGYAQSGLGLGPGFFLVGVDFERILNGGSLAIIAECRKELAARKNAGTTTQESTDFLGSVIMVHEAFIKLAARYADLAEKLSAVEKDPGRKKELVRIAAACRWVPANPARNFFEALQSFWLTFLLISPSPTAAGGRFDQFMYPFYKKDIDAGVTNDAEVLELLECLRIKDMKLNRVSGQQNRKKNAGMAKWHNWTIGGVDANGNDVTNELSYLLLEAAKEMKIPHHTLTLRVHDKTPEALMVKALEVVKTGIGLPAFVADKSYVNFFVRQGLSREDSRNYIMTGCLDGNIPAMSRTVAVGMFLVALGYDIFMHDGFNQGTGEQVGIKTGDVTVMKSFAEYKDSFYRQLDYLIELAVDKSNIELRTQRELFPDPFRSSLMKDAIKEGKDMLSRVMPLENALVLCTIGTVNVADSMAAVKKLVYDDKKYSMSQLMQAIEANWEGFESMRADFLAAPKYGNDDDYVDLLAADLYEHIERKLATMDTAYGGKAVATAISITSHQPGGALTGATPDGRRKGEILADGSMSPMHGMDRKGPTGVLKSAMKIDQDAYQATLLNMKFHPSALNTENDMKKLASLMKTYFAHGGKHVQFNIVDRETLVAAQAEPEAYSDLVVRVAGYSAYFNALGKPMQDEIIERTEYAQV